MPTEWYYTQGGKRVGPAREDQMRYLVASGELLPSDLVWTEGMQEWSPAGEVEGLLKAKVGRWYYANEGQRRGPVDWSDLCDLVSSGRLRSDDLVWTEGMACWRRAIEIEGLFAPPNRDLAKGVDVPNPRSRQIVEEIPPKSRDRDDEQATATWVFGSILLTFFLGVFLFGPPELPEFKQRMIAVSSALLAGLFGYFLTGRVHIKIEPIEQWFGEVGVKATGGSALFVVVMIWWLSPFAPIKTSVGLKEVEVVLKDDWEDAARPTIAEITINKETPVEGIAYSLDEARWEECHKIQKLDEFGIFKITQARGMIADNQTIDSLKNGRGIYVKWKSKGVWNSPVVVTLSRYDPKLYSDMTKQRLDYISRNNEARKTAASVVRQADSIKAETTRLTDPLRGLTKQVTEDVSIPNNQRSKPTSGRGTNETDRAPARDLKPSVRSEAKGVDLGGRARVANVPDKSNSEPHRKDDADPRDQVKSGGGPPYVTDDTPIFKNASDSEGLEYVGRLWETRLMFRDVCFSRNSRTLLAAGDHRDNLIHWQGVLLLCDPASGKCQMAMRELHKGGILKVIPLQAGNRAITVGKDGEIKIWQTNPPKEVGKILLSEGEPKPRLGRNLLPLLDVDCLVTDNDELIYFGMSVDAFYGGGSLDTVVCVAPGGGAIKFRINLDGTFRGISLSHDRRTLAVIQSVKEKKVVKFFEALSGQEIPLPRALSMTLGSPDDFRLSPRDSSAAICTYSVAESRMTTKIVDLNSGRTITLLEANHTNPPRKIVFSPDGNRLASIPSRDSDDAKKHINIWDVRSGKMLAWIHGGAESVAFSPDGERFALVRELNENQGKAFVWIIKK